MKAKYFLLGVIFAFGIMALSVFAFFLGRNFRSDTEKTDQGAFSVTPLPTSAPAAKPDPRELTDKVIQKAIETGDYASLEGYFTESVVVRIENSGCCSPQTPPEVVEQLDYLDSAAGAWDFDQGGDVAKILEATYPEHYSNAFIAINDDGFSVAFQFDEETKIAKVSLSAAYTLLVE